jgi:hypothetical protein
VAEDGLKNGRRGLPEWLVEVWAKTPIYSCGAHIATSFVPAAVLIPERIQSGFSDPESTRYPFSDVRVTG